MKSDGESPGSLTRPPDRRPDTKEGEHGGPAGLAKRGPMRE